MSISVTGIDVTIGTAAILRGIDLTVRQGELLTLVGPNGAGKSTLLGVLAGDITPGAGTVTLDDAPVADWKVRELSRRRAVLLQEQGLAFGFRVVDVVRMGRAPWAGTEREDHDDDVVAGAMLRTEVLHLGERSYPTLSGGEKARTSFARILAQQTTLVLLDEPTAALDIRHQEQVLTAARALADDGHAVVAVLHDLSLAAAYADRVCVMADGRVAADGAPREVLTADLLTSVYGHAVDVIEHAGSLLVVPQRPAGASAALPKETPCVSAP